MRVSLNEEFYYIKKISASVCSEIVTGLRHTDESSYITASLTETSNLCGFFHECVLGISKKGDNSTLGLVTDDSPGCQVSLTENSLHLCGCFRMFVCWEIAKM